MKTLTKLRAVALIAACIAQACTANTQAGRIARPTIDACALLDAKEIGRVVNMPMEAGVRKNIGATPDGAFSSTCVWAVRSEPVGRDETNAPFGGRSFVILNAIRWPSEDMAHRFLDPFYIAAERGELPVQPIRKNVGDAALWWGDGLAVTRENTGFGISVFVPNSHVDRPGVREEMLAARVLARLDESRAPTRAWKHR